MFIYVYAYIYIFEIYKYINADAVVGIDTGINLDTYIHDKAVRPSFSTSEEQELDSAQVPIAGSHG